MNNKLLGSSPKTSILGIIAGICTGLIPFVPQQWQQLLSAIAGLATVYLGREAKDSNRITKDQDVTVAKAATDGTIPPEK